MEGPYVRHPAAHDDIGPGDVVLHPGLGAASFVLLLLTLVWHDWIEIVFGADPDQHGGLAEWLVVAVLALVTVTLAVLARIDLRRLRTAGA